MFRSFSGSQGGRSFNSRPRFSRPSRGQNISHSRYIHAAVALTTEEAPLIVNSFADFGFEPQVLKNISTHGYTIPTPIQDQAIPALMEGRDVVGVANTGTGKTAAFLLPLINKVVKDPNQGVLIIAPTRELAVQIHEEFVMFAKNLPVSVSLCIGGVGLNSQIQYLKENPHFVIGTPGRLKDLVNRNALRPDMFTNIVLDEVDRMLDIGFRKDIKFLISMLPKERHAAFFSATMNHEIEEIMRELLSDPVKISVKKRDTHLHISQDIVKVPSGAKKLNVLFELLQQEDFKRVIVFGRTKHGINALEQDLFDRGIQVRSIHGNKNQNARQHSLKDFKTGRVNVLLATDIAARGIDVDDVTHVINYDEPQSYEDYIHRIGRTGRAGKSGKALTFVS